MPITKSAKKALRVSRRRQAINLRTKRAYKETVRDVRRLVSAPKTPKGTKSKRKTATRATTEARKIATTEAQKKNEAQKNTLSKAYSELDKAAKKGIIHKNKAARLKSRLVKLVQA